MNELKLIPVDSIKVGEYAQRIDLEDPETLELAESLKRIGMLNPLIVVRSAEGYLLIAGHRRLCAAKLASLDTVPCTIREEDLGDASEICFAENFFRKDLSPIELACALKDCLTNKIKTVEQLAAGFHKSEHWVQSMVAIAEWPGDVQQAIHNEHISVAAGSNLACVTEPEYRAFLVQNAVDGGATARTTAAWLQAWRALLPAEEAVQAPPVPQGAPQAPLVPQAPCLCCAQLFGVNEMSHVPVCGACIQLLRVAGQQLAE